MKTLFSDIEQEKRMAVAPLAVRMRPRTLDEVVGQKQAVGPGSWLRRAIENDALSSIILFGPAGTGKTSLARVIAHTTQAEFVEVSAIGGTVSDLRREISAAQERLEHYGLKTILFVDEIHRFNRSQQDALLHAVEDRVVILIGATTENPFFEVNTALNSRSRIIELVSLTDEEISQLLDRALTDERGLNGRFALEDDARDAIILLAGGDGRASLTTLELASDMAAARAADVREASRNLQTERCSEKGECSSEDCLRTAESGPSSAGIRASQSTGREVGDEMPSPASADGVAAEASAATSDGGGGPFAKIIITRDDVQSAVPHRPLPYDKNKDQHYDIISAFIKSMRGSDPDAALYWMARMIDGGEDPKFIARRMMIAASEDIGNADPMALLVAEAAFKSAEVIGYPECRINLAQAAIYLALAPKSNAAEAGIDAALAEVRKGPKREVPSYLRDRHRPGSEEYGQYKYPHNYPGGWVDQQYLPDGLEPGCFYKPSDRGWESYRADAAARDRQ